MKKHLLKFAWVVTIPFLFTSCNKEDVTNSDEFDAAQETGISQNMESAPEDEAAYRMADPSMGGCATITFSADEGTFPNTLTIDFGTTGCAGIHGRIHTGKIVVEMSDAIKNPGAVHIITLVDFATEGHAMEGTRTITNLGSNESGEMQWSVVLVGGKITLPDGKVASMDANHLRTQIAGADTDECEDDVFEITGSRSGITPKGKSMSSVITTPLVRRRDCRWIVSGVETVSCDKHSRSLDFGDGTCDDLAVVSGDRGTKEIHLRR